MNFWLIGFVIVAFIGIVSQAIELQSAYKTIQAYETLIWVQDEIVTQYREKFGDIEIKLDKGE